MALFRMEGESWKEMSGAFFPKMTSNDGPSPFVVTPQSNSGGSDVSTTALVNFYQVFDQNTNTRIGYSSGKWQGGCSGYISWGNVEIIPLEITMVSSGSNATSGGTIEGLSDAVSNGGQKVAEYCYRIRGTNTIVVPEDKQVPIKALGFNAWTTPSGQNAYISEIQITKWLQKGNF